MKNSFLEKSGLGAEKILGALGIITQNPGIQFSALLPSIITSYLSEKEIIKTDIPKKLQIQLTEAITKTIRNCERKLNTQYLGNKLSCLKKYADEFKYETVSYNHIQNLINDILSKEANEKGTHITQKELDIIWDMFIDEFEYVILEYPELTGHVLVSMNKQMIKTLKEHKDDASQITIPRILTEKAPLPPEEYYGRENEFDNILKKMKTETKFVLVNGMGGVGKSTLARKLYHYFFTSSDKKLIWIAYNGHSLRDDFMKQMLYPANHNEEEMMLFLFNSLHKDTVIFIDNLNVTKVEDEFITRLEALDCYVICTSRVKELSHFKSIPIDFFNEEQSIHLFASYYNREFDEKLIKEIVSRANYHTLVIEVIAKIGMSEGMSLIEIIKELSKKGFQLSGVTEINLDEKTLVGHLCKLFSTRKLTNQQKYILVNMSVFDLYYIPNEFLKWIHLPNKSGLNYLENHAWINRTNTGYYMHPLIVEVVKRLCDTNYHMVQKMVCGLAEYFKFNPNKCASDFMPLFPYAQNIVRRYGNECTKDMISLLYNISIIQWQFGDYKNAEKSVKQTIKNAEKINGFPQIELAEYINHHGVICHSLKKYHRAIRIYEKALELRKNSSNKRDIAQTLSNIALEYQILYEDEHKQEWINKSIAYQTASNKLFENIFADINLKHANMASAYNNTGRLYYIQKNFPEAIKYFNKALEIRKEILPAMHEELEITYYYLGCAYEKYAETQIKQTDKQTYLKKSIELYKASLKIRKYNFEKGIKKYDPEEVQKKIKNIQKYFSIK